MRRALNVQCAGLVLFLCVAGVVLRAQAGAPAINRIDPPNWWAKLPDPMLLVYGENLTDAKFAVTGHGVTVLKAQSSANGHYAFVWLATKGASTQRLRIKATNGAGSAEAEWDLKAREPESGRHQ